ncbi:hypothetical protein V144x_18120 [Gimesia aquarii]|uniref:Uncharacterized protein n=1 Tax=Gimesia aquarii TaxID=2527964 RepID=A0A517VTM7_9PLAN|nr:hypothetical protein V144x_18120 [Gimesia aquarii]
MMTFHETEVGLRQKFNRSNKDSIYNYSAHFLNDLQETSFERSVA